MNSSSVDQSNARDAKSSVEGSKHTPGPWFWAVDRRDQPTALMRSGTGDYVITPQADVGDYGLSVDPWNDVSEADARLIAAAPDLLDALQQAALCLREVFKLDGGVVNIARSAIAKATGEPSPADTAGPAAGSVSHREEPK